MWWVLALGYTGLLIVMLLGPSVPRPPLFPHDDKAFHLLAFAGVGGAWWLALRRVRPVWAVGLSMAVLTELGQALLPYGRAGDPLDALADVAGVALGLLVGRWLRRT